MDIAKQLRRWRGVKGKGRLARGEFTQAEAAKQLGVPLKTYIDWENGRFEPRGLARSVVLERIGGK